MSPESQPLSKVTLWALISTLTSFLRYAIKRVQATGGHFECACVNMGCWSATEAFSVDWLRSVPAFAAVFWSWMTCIGCYVPQTCSLRYRCISTTKISLLLPRCRTWEYSLSFRETVHRRQDGGWMFLRPNTSCTFFEQEEKVSVIIFL